MQTIPRIRKRVSDPHFVHYRVRVLSFSISLSPPLRSDPGNEANYLNAILLTFWIGKFSSRVREESNPPFFIFLSKYSRAIPPGPGTSLIARYLTPIRKIPPHSLSLLPFGSSKPFFHASWGLSLTSLHGFTNTGFHPTSLLFLL